MTINDQPILATPHQLAAEATLAELLEDAQLRATQARLRAELADSPRGQTRDGAATLDRAIALWTNSAVLGAIADARSPHLYWVSDNSPRSWFGRSFAGFGVCGDNPDFINRSAVLHPGCRYEVVGQFAPPPLRTAQWVMELSRTGGRAFSKEQLSRNRADMGTQIRMMTDRDLELSPAGEFHIPIEATEPCQLLFRDVRSDWAQRASRMTVRQIDGPLPPVASPGELHAQALEKLTGFVCFWANYLDSWFGGLAPNSISPTIERDRGWGFMAGLHYALEPGEVIILRTRTGGARYAGAQLVDPWMLTSDARRYQNSLNLAQAVPDEGGDTTTFVISPVDPGVANWLDTSGLHDGYGILRWQAVGQDTRKDDLVVDFRVAKLAQAAALDGVARCDATERQASIAARHAGYESRLG